MVTDALVVAPDEGQLHRRLQLEVLVALDDGGDVVPVQLIQLVVEVVERCGQGRVALDEGVDGELEQAGWLGRSWPR